MAEQSSGLVPELTADGSLTFYSVEFGETFHSRQGALQEAVLKFVEPTQLQSKAQQGSLRLLDICYGLGYNTGAALEAIWSANPACQVELIALEHDSTVPLAAIHFWCSEQQHEDAVSPQGGLEDRRLNAIAACPWSRMVTGLLTTLAAQHQIQTPYLNAQLLLGDARQTIQDICQSSFLADAIFLDPFSPPHCPQLWTVEFLACVARCLQPEGRLATYSCSAAVRTALMAAGLQIGSTTPVGRKSPGTVASFSTVDLCDLSAQEHEHLLTRAAIPYRDPLLSDPAPVMLARRRAEQQSSSLEPTSHWKKRWAKTDKAGSVSGSEIAKQP